MVDKIFPVSGEIAHLQSDGISRPVKDTKARDTINKLIDSINNDFATKEWVKSTDGSQLATYEKPVDVDQYTKDETPTYTADHYIRVGSDSYKSAEGADPILYNETYTKVSVSTIQNITIKAGLDTLATSDKYLSNKIAANSEKIAANEINININKTAIATLNNDVTKPGSVANKIYNNAVNAKYDSEKRIGEKIAELEQMVGSVNRGQFKKVDSYSDIPCTIDGIGYIWLVPDDHEGFKEYSVIDVGTVANPVYEITEFGNTHIDLSGYATHDWVHDNAVNARYAETDDGEQSIGDKLEELDNRVNINAENTINNATNIENINTHLNTVDSELENHEFRISEIVSAPVNVIKSVSVDMGTISVPKLILSATHTVDEDTTDSSVSYLTLSSYDEETETLILNQVKVKSSQADIEAVTGVTNESVKVYGVPTVNGNES